MEAATAGHDDELFLWVYNGPEFFLEHSETLFKLFDY